MWNYRGDWPFRHTIPHSRHLILHFKRPKALVDCVQYCIALVTASPSIEAGDDDPMWAGQVRAPVELEAIVHPLTAGAPVPAQVSNGVSDNTVKRANERSLD